MNRTRPMHRPRLKHILKAVAKIERVSVTQLIGTRRLAYISQARLLFAGVCKYFEYRNYEIAYGLHRVRSSGDYYANEAMLLMQSPRFTKRVEAVASEAEKIQKHAIQQILRTL